MISNRLLCLATLTLAFGCSATNPSPELVDARRAYDEARHSEALNYAPDKVLSAKQALDRAEGAYQDSPGSFEEKSLAYVAQRRANTPLLTANTRKIDVIRRRPSKPTGTRKIACVAMPSSRPPTRSARSRRLGTT